MPLLRFILIFLVFYLFSCASPEEGCLDVNASNYEVMADESCCEDDVEDCCCEYPKLQLFVKHRLERDSNLSFSFQDFHTVESDSSHFFQVNDIRFYISDLKLHSPSGQAFGVTDTLNIQAIDDNGNLIEATIEDNIVLVKRTQNQYDIGSFEGITSFDSISFLVGIDEPLNHVLYENLPSNHVLARTGEDSLYINSSEGFIFNKINLKKDTLESLEDITLEINSLNSVGLAFETPVEVSRGVDITINLRINYIEWFKGIKFAVDSDEQIKNSIKQNTVNIFELEE